MFKALANRRLAAKAKELGLKPVELPGQSICMDGQMYRELYETKEERFPTAAEQAKFRLARMGKMWSGDKILEFINDKGQLIVTRRTPLNREALEKAGYVYDMKEGPAHFERNCLPAGKNKDLYDELLRTPQDETERLVWAVRDNDMPAFNDALAKGANIANAQADYKHVIFRTLADHDLPLRDEFVRRLLPESPLIDTDGETLLHYALCCSSPTTLIPDLLQAGVDPFHLNKRGIPAFLNLNVWEEKTSAQQELKLVVDAMLKKPDMGKKEKQQIQAQSRLIHAAIDEYGLGSHKLDELMCRLKGVYAFVHAIAPGDSGKIPAMVTSLLEPLVDAAGARDPLQAKGASNLLETIGHADTSALNGQLNDFIGEFTAHVVLPQALLRYAEESGKPLTEAFLRTIDSSKLMTALTYPTKMKLLGERSIDKIIGLNAAWHEAAFPDGLRPIKATGEWHSLTGQKEHEVPHLPGITIRVLTTKDELVAEGTVMNHCVKGNDYVMKGLTGKSHLFSVRKAGQEQPLSTIEGLWDGRNFTIKQNFGEQNAHPAGEAIQAGEWLKAQLDSNKITANRKLGETDASKARNARPEILRTIGYELTQENINAAFAEYTQNPKRRAREINPETQKFDGISRRTELISGSHNYKVTGEDGNSPYAAPINSVNLASSVIAARLAASVSLYLMAKWLVAVLSLSASSLQKAMIEAKR